MPTTAERNKSITCLLNSTYTSLKSTVPIDLEIAKPEILKGHLHLQYGVLIGITGDIQGKLVFAGNISIFSSIGEAMFGMPLDGEMLISFSGELGNMIAGGISTNLVGDGISLNITFPTIMQGDTNLSGYKQAIVVHVRFQNVGEMDTYLLLD